MFFNLKEYHGRPEAFFDALLQTLEQTTLTWWFSQRCTLYYYSLLEVSATVLNHNKAQSHI